MPRMHAIWFAKHREGAEALLQHFQMFYSQKNIEQLIPRTHPASFVIDLRRSENGYCVVASYDADGTDAHDYVRVVAGSEPHLLVRHIPVAVREMRVVKTVRVGFKRLGD